MLTLEFSDRNSIKVPPLKSTPRFKPLNNKTKINLINLTEDCNKFVPCTYGVTKIDGKDMVVISLGKYKPSQLYQAANWSDERGDYLNYMPNYNDEFSNKDRIVISHEDLINRVQLT